MWDLATAKIRLGIVPGDTTQDTAIQTALNTSLELAEKYCDRFFLYAAQRARFYYTRAESYSLTRYPIDQVTSISTSAAHKVHHVAGMIEFPGYVFDEELTIEYTGGYKVLPNDLELALWMLFDKVWSNISGTGGGAPVGGIRSFRVGDISLGFDTGAAASSASSQGAFGGLIDPIAAGILNLYRREGC
jgi:hypothetical protein